RSGGHIRHLRGTPGSYRTARGDRERPGRLQELLERETERSAWLMRRVLGRARPDETEGRSERLARLRKCPSLRPSDRPSCARWVPGPVRPVLRWAGTTEPPRTSRSSSYRASEGRCEFTATVEAGESTTGSSGNG